MWKTATLLMCVLAGGAVMAAEDDGAEPWDIYTAERLIHDGKSEEILQWAAQQVDPLSPEMLASVAIAQIETGNYAASLKSWLELRQRSADWRVNFSRKDPKPVLDVLSSICQPRLPRRSCCELLSADGFVARRHGPSS